MVLKNLISFMPETGDPRHPSSFNLEKQHSPSRRATCNHLRRPCPHLLDPPL